MGLWSAVVLFSDDAAQFEAMRALTQRHAELTRQRSHLAEQQAAAAGSAEQAASELRAADKAADRLRRMVGACLRATLRFRFYRIWSYRIWV